MVSFSVKPVIDSIWSAVYKRVLFPPISAWRIEDETPKSSKLFNPILVQYSNDKDISIILQKKDLVVAKSQLNITEEVIKIINIEVKEFKIKLNNDQNIQKVNVVYN